MRIPNIWDNWRYLCVYMYILLGKSQILRKFISLGLFLLQDTAGSTAFNVEYPWIFTLFRLVYLIMGVNILNTQVNCSKVAVKWQSLPYQPRKFPNLWDCPAQCMLNTEKLIKIFHSNFSARQRHTEWQQVKINNYFLYCTYFKKKFPRAGNSCNFLHNTLYCLVCHISTIVKYL